MKIYLSEFGKHTHFRGINAAIEHCAGKKKFLNGEKGIVWIRGTSREEMTEWMKKHKGVIDHNYMFFAYATSTGKFWVWDRTSKSYYTTTAFNKWDNDCWEGETPKPSLCDICRKDKTLQKCF
jgi:hypothetical protein